MPLTHSEPPVVPRHRALAPDLARGSMLALIALAHSQVLAGHTIGPSGATGSGTDTAVQAVLTLFVDSRGYPMFAALFGYGMVQILRRQEPAGGWAHARRQLRRRGLWMIVFGFAHTVLLFTGDILAAYGVLAVLLVGALRWRDGRLLAAAGAAAAVGALVYGAVLAAPIPAGDASEHLTDPFVSAAFRLALFPVLTPMNAVMAAGPVLVGVWAARRRLLDEPDRHRLLLRRVAAVGVAVAVLGAVPQVLVTTGVWHPAPGALLAVGALHTAAGYAGGLGYAALLGLLAARLGAAARARPGGDRAQRVRAALHDLLPGAAVASACPARPRRCYAG
ncbi:DUF418 domain-containing protein [Pseudonocardia nigra]|uniref:DUF418 domain-containing protein n=1 Tax=Pseudonocardia nigra TaxID=1921578 RepID=UPI001C5E3DF6|nr:DUF418 domain-containing protein [Pseudonocardia nigra]